MSEVRLGHYSRYGGECSKCGEAGRRVTYCAAATHADGREHLHVVCVTCGFDHLCATKDAERSYVQDGTGR